MSNPLVEKLWSQLTLLPEGSHAKMSQSQGRRPESRKAPAVDSGLSSTESFANYDPDTSSWRTSQACLLTGWEEFSQTWPKSGMMRNGKCYRRQMSAHPTYVNASSSPHMTEFPTPAAARYGSSGNEGGGNTLSAHRPSLETMASKNLWPTPTRHLDSMYVDNSPNSDKRHSRGLASEVEHRWPTPTTRDYKGVGPNGRWRDGKLQLDTLDRAVQNTDGIGQLNPTWVEWLMGFPLGWTDLKD